MNQQINSKFSIWPLLVILIVAFHTSANAVWLMVNNSPPSWDPASHTWITLTIVENLKSLNFLRVIHSSNYYPIFVHTMASILLMTFGPNIKIAQFAGSIFFVIILIALYFYTKILFQNRRIACFATAIFSLFPIVFDQSRRLMLDIPTATMLIISLIFLKKSEYFTNRKMTLLFFISTGLLLMTKWTGIIFLILPVAFVLFELAKEDLKLKAFRNILFGLMLTILIALPWYATNFSSLEFLTRINLTSYADQPKNLLTIENAIYYLKLFINYQVTPLIALLFFCSLFYIRPLRNKLTLQMFTLIIVNYLFFTFIHNKDPRYILPLLPFVAIFIAIALNKLIDIHRKIGAIFAILVFIYLGAYFLVLTIRPIILEGARESMYLPGLHWINVIDINDFLVKKYDNRNWQIDETLKSLEDKNKPGITIVAYEGECFNPSTLQAYLKSGQLQGEFKNIILTTPDIAFMNYTYNFESFPSEESITKYIRSANYIIVSPSGLGTTYLRNKKALTQLQQHVLENSLVSCDLFQDKVSPDNINCRIQNGEILQTTSDMLIDNKLIQDTNKTIVGPAKIYCPWRCSFRQVKSPSEVIFPEVTLVKKINLPDGSDINIYKVNKQF